MHVIHLASLIFLDLIILITFGDKSTSYDAIPIADFPNLLLLHSSWFQILYIEPSS
jgi:hypothetical protein